MHTMLPTSAYFECDADHMVSSSDFSPFESSDDSSIDALMPVVLASSSNLLSEKITTEITTENLPKLSTASIGGGRDHYRHQVSESANHSASIKLAQAVVSSYSQPILMSNECININTNTNTNTNTTAMHTKPPIRASAAPLTTNTRQATTTTAAATPLPDQQHMLGMFLNSNLRPSASPYLQNNNTNFGSCPAPVLASNMIDGGTIAAFVKEQDVKKGKLARKAELARISRKRKRLRLDELELEVEILKSKLRKYENGTLRPGQVCPEVEKDAFLQVKIKERKELEALEQTVRSTQLPQQDTACAQMAPIDQSQHGLPNSQPGCNNMNMMKSFLANSVNILPSMPSIDNTGMDTMNFLPVPSMQQYLAQQLKQQELMQQQQDRFLALYAKIAGQQQIQATA